MKRSKKKTEYTHRQGRLGGKEVADNRKKNNQGGRKGNPEGGISQPALEKDRLQHQGRIGKGKKTRTT